MKNRLKILLLLASTGCFAQQKIIAFRGREIPAEILSKDGDTIRYRNIENGKEGKIAKNLTWKIQNQVGPPEYFFTDAELAMSLDDVKAKVVETISASAYEEDSSRQQYAPEFEGDYIRMKIVKREKTVSKGLLFNFGQVYQFHPVSDRGEYSYVNIYVDFLDNPKKMKWAKRKLIMKVKGFDNGIEIMRWLQVLHHKLTVQKTT